LVDADARRRPTVLVTVSVRSAELPEVVISPPAKRVCPVHEARTTTRVSSAVAYDSTRFVSASISARVSCGMGVTRGSRC
jgi:hypothetical protein